MKKFIDPRPIPNGGMPVFGGDFVECLQTEVYRAITAQYKSLNEPSIIYGCQVVADLDAETCTIAAGLAFLNGDLVDVPAYAGAYPVYLQEGSVTEFSKNYKDQSPRVVMLKKTSVWLSGAGDDDNILFDPYTSQYLKDVQRRVQTPINRCEWFPDYPNAAAFDVTGLGKWEWLGYSVANSNNGTAPMTGLVPAQFNSADTDMHIGNTFGTKSEALTGDQNGPHTHKGDAAAYYTRSGGTERCWGEGGPGDFFQTKSSGTGAAHNNMQPTIFGIWLQRRPY